MRRGFVLLFFVGCVPHVPLDGAPCPCDLQSTCCDTLGVCLAAGQTCPATVPSTSDNCETDDDCSAFEACAAWRLEDGSLAGPHVCRRRCVDHPCDGDERCLFSPTNGRATGELAFAKLCLDVAPSCSDWTCEGCGDLALGEVTPCIPNQGIEGCLFSIHPTCGLKCERRALGLCDALVSPCTANSCDNCVDSSVAAPICDMGTERTCMASTSSGGMAECERLCVEVETGMCEP